MIKEKLKRVILDNKSYGEVKVDNNGESHYVDEREEMEFLLFLFYENLDLIKDIDTSYSGGNGKIIKIELHDHEVFMDFVRYCNTSKKEYLEKYIK